MRRWAPGRTVVATARRSTPGRTVAVTARHSGRGRTVAATARWSGRGRTVAATARWSGRGRTVAGLCLAAVALLAGCTDGRANAGPVGTASPAASHSAATPTPTPAAGAPGAGDVRATGTPVSAGEPVLRALAAPGVTLAVAPDEDAATRVTFTDGDAPSPPASGARTVAWLTGPDGTTFRVLDDGSALLSDAAGSPVVGIGAPPAPGALTTDGALLTVVGPTSLWLTATAVDGTDWGDREGGRSLAVSPSPWARAGGEAAQELTWAQVVAQAPEADSTSMHDQLVCHMLGAPDKATWNLEPWRPDVSALEMLAARCNPT